MSAYDDYKLDNAEDEAARRIRAKRIACDDCDDAIAEIWAEDLTGYDPAGGAYLCERCADKRYDGDYDAPDAGELAHRQAEAMRLKR
jgi:hypothetical protein